MFTQYIINIKSDLGVGMDNVGISFINKKAPVRRLFEPEAFHLQISSINLEETFVLLYISHVFQYVQPLHQQQVNLGR